MREIKYRVWDRETESMYGSEYIDSINFAEGIVCCSSGGYNEIEWDCEIENAVFMQYTGLKDTEGQEIYEGDILKGVFEYLEMDGMPKEAVDIGEVRFDENSACYIVCGVNKTMGELSDWHQEKLYVIGNIYENPELLEVKNV